jgi:hypothetical protein
MSKSTHPYAIIQRRIDIVTRVPDWAQDTIAKGTEVVRMDAQTVYITGRGKYKIGESYTKFDRYSTPLELF